MTTATRTRHRPTETIREAARLPATVAESLGRAVRGARARRHLGDVGVLEMIRDRTKVPYRVSRSLAGKKKVIEEGEVYVRHGSHVAKASDDEIADLEAEAGRARGEG